MPNQDVNDGFDDLDDLDDGDTGDDQGRQSNPLNDLRAKLRRETKARKEAETERDELRTFKTEYETTTRKETVGNLFKALGLTAKPDLYPADAEITKEAVAAFAKDSLGVQVQLEPSEETQDQEVESFAPVSVAGSVPVKGNVTQEAWRVLQRTDPVQAARLLRDGRVENLAPVDNSGSPRRDW